MALLLEQVDERSEHERVRAGREVDPDLHAKTCSSERVAADTFDVPLVPQREGEEAPELPREVLAARDVVVRSRLTTSGCRNPCLRTFSGLSVSRANG